MAGQLVIVRHYEPPPAEEAAEVLHRVYARIFDSATLERLTRPRTESTIEEEKESHCESSAVRQG